MKALSPFLFSRASLAVFALFAVSSLLVAEECLLWKSHIGSPLWAPPAEADGILYFGADDGQLRAFDLSARELRWEFATGGLIRSGVALHDGQLFCVSDDGFLYGLDRERGELGWQFDLELPEEPRRLPAFEGPYDYDFKTSTPVIDEASGLLFVGSANGKLHALQSATGELVWTFATEGSIRANSTIAAERVFLSSWDGHVYALALETGEEVWKFNTGGIVQSDPVYADGLIFVGSRSTKVFAIDAATGAPKWTYTYEDGSWVESSACVFDETVYLGSSDNLTLKAFDAATGVVRWSFSTGGWSWGQPVVKDGVAYIGAVSASPYYFEGVELQAGFFAVDAADGTLRWEFPAAPIGGGYITGGYYAPPIVVDGVVYLAGLDGWLYALRAE